MWLINKTDVWNVGFGTYQIAEHTVVENTNLNQNVFATNIGSCLILE